MDKAWFFPLLRFCVKSILESLECVKMADLALKESQKLISRKIWVIEKSRTFHTVFCQLFVYNLDLLVWRGSRDSVETTRWCPLFRLGSSWGWPVDEVKCVRFDLTLEVGEVTTDEMAELSAENLVGVWLLSRPVVTSSWWFLTNRLFLELLWCWCWWYILLLKCCCCCCFLRITEPELKK